MENPKLALIPSGYKSGKVYSILPVNGVGDFDYERNGDASRVRKDGLIEELTVDDTPRLDWLNSDCPSLLLEPQRTNYAIHSNDASQWSNVGGSQSITKTQNYSIAPNGKKTATRLQATATGSGYSLIALTTTSFSGNYTGSVYLKSNKGDIENVAIYGRNTTVASYEIGNEWQRIELQGSGTSGQNLYLFLGSFPNNNSDESIDVLVWGGQLEQGNYATSLITTGSVIATRQKDICNNAGDSQLLNNPENTFFIDLNKIYKTGTGDSRISLNDGSSTNRVLFSTQTNDTTIILYSIRNNVTTTVKYFSVDYDASNKIAYTFKDNEIKFYVNGEKIHEALFLPIPLNLSKISFDENNGGSRSFQGEVNEIRYYDRALTEAEAIKLTTT